MSHMAIGTPNCCAFIEIIPKVPEFLPIHGHGNMARHLGIYHYRHVVTTPHTGAGSVVEIQDIIKITKQAIRTIQNKPTCLMNVKLR